METLFVGKNLIFLPETDSTNSYAIHLLKNVNTMEGTVVHTARQTKGKGQRGTSWKAEEPGNLAASVILKPSFLPMQKQFFLYVIAALATYDTTTELLGAGQFDTKIKWPNDILVNKKKIAGILIENNITSNSINWSVTGVGLNISESKFNDFAATSIKLLSGEFPDAQQALKILCRQLEKYYLALRNKEYDYLRALYLRRLYGLGQTLPFRVNGQQKNMTIEGVSESGLLVLQPAGEAKKEVDVKEIEWILGQQ
jgi:BirA family biotin operon repressor/biotin-[acetyl-CoA-carboxylase] ligase